LNYMTAYQMLHRSAKARPGQRMLIHGASGGVGTAMLQLARLAGVEMYGTCSAQGAAVVRELGGIPIDYKNADFVTEIHRLTSEDVDAAFDGIGGDNLWRSRDALREGGRVVTYGFQSKMCGGRMVSRSEGRHPIRESAKLGWFIFPQLVFLTPLPDRFIGHDDAALGEKILDIPETQAEAMISPTA
jgi:NADPH:quinone reductase-like Zn-dependent oxidoreductase